MRIYDISQEVFSSCVYPGDPAPVREQVASMERGDVCNLSSFSMCTHNGTHVDAPYHFFRDGRQIHELSCEALVGECFVASFEGKLLAKDACEILEKARALGEDCARRILIRGRAVVSSSAAAIFAESGVLLLGNESQTVGEEQAPAEVHRILLGQGVILLEGIRLSEVAEGAYFLFAAPLNLKGCDGSPCRAMLVRF